MPEYTDPDYAGSLAVQLKALGFSSSAFAVVHHGDGNLADFIAYCKAGPKRFNYRDDNDMLCRRLEMVLHMYRAGHFAQANSTVFELLAQTAVLEYPKNRPMTPQPSPASSGKK